MQSGETVVIAAGLAGKRADTALAEALGLTRSRVAGLLEDGHITRDGRPVKANARVKQGEQYCVRMPSPQAVLLQAQDIPLNILYQDADVAVINKPRGMAVHPSPGIPDGTLVNALLHCLDGLSGINGELRPGIVHRIDKDTTGAIIVAKNDEAHMQLSQQLQARTLKRVYLALVYGRIQQETGTIDAPIGRHKTDRKRMAVVPDGREARTHYRVLERFADSTLVECRLETGRTHQIRVHMASIGHPVLEDPVYGVKKDRATAKGQLLHAAQLSFLHPRTGEKMTVDAPPPRDFLDALEKRRKKL